MNTYPINEIFYSLQGEGCHAGRPAVFIRFSGCNLQCPFCDTDHRAKTMMSADDILAEINKYNTEFIVLTGGEPSLFVDKELTDILKAKNYYIAIETNGTRKIPEGIDWITVSPKQHLKLKGSTIRQKECDEVKLIWEDMADMYEIADEYFIKMKCDYSNYFVQPCDTGDEDTNRRLLKDAISFCLSNPDWRLSVQLHKLLNFK